MKLVPTTPQRVENGRAEILALDRSSDLSLWAAGKDSPSESGIYSHEAASERLGHSKTSITLDTYAHVLPDMQERAVDAIDAALSRASS
jgi:hypothetical protein